MMSTLQSILKFSVLTISFMALLASAVIGENNMDIDKMTSVLRTYEKNLNAGDVDGIIALYSDEGVFMPQHSQPQVGKEAVREAYIQVFNNIDLDIVFEIDEVEQLSKEWGFARTRSKGTTTILANGSRVAEGNQELFLLKKDSSGNWKIARYIFSTTNPRQ